MDLLECLEFADLRVEHLTLFKAVDVLIRVAIKHMDNEDNRIKDYWREKGDRPKHEFTRLTEAKFNELRGLYSQLDRFELLLGDKGLLS